MEEPTANKRSSSLVECYVCHRCGELQIVAFGLKYTKAANAACRVLWGYYFAVWAEVQFYGKAATLRTLLSVFKYQCGTVLTRFRDLRFHDCPLQAPE